jgi:hypothetical protein
MSTNPVPNVTVVTPPKVEIDPTPAPTPTRTFYQTQAASFMQALDEMSKVIPNLENAHPATAQFVRSHLNVSLEFLATAIAAVEQTPELQAVNKMDVTAAKDALQFIEAFRPVLDKLSAFARALKDTMDTRRANLCADALQIYAIAKGVARDPGASAMAVHVANLKRKLGRRGRPLKEEPAPSSGTNPPPGGVAA